MSTNCLRILGSKARRRSASMVERNRKGRMRHYAVRTTLFGEAGGKYMIFSNNALRMTLYALRVFLW